MSEASTHPNDADVQVPRGVLDCGIWSGRDLVTVDAIRRDERVRGGVEVTGQIGLILPVIAAIFLRYRDDSNSGLQFSG